MMVMLDLLLDLLLSPWVFVPLVYPGLVSAFALLLFIIWAERKMAGKVQMRYGPLYVLKPLGGIIQLVADLIRYLFQEPIVPEEADAAAFVLAPIAMFTACLLPVVAIPVGPEFYAFRSDISLLAFLALSSLAPAFTVAVGWASSNKFSLIGGLREGYLALAYEVPLVVSALAGAALYGTMDLVEMAEAQSSVWGVCLNPLAALVFLLLVYMETSRFPFEISEAESEIVMGPFTEYSGILYGLCMGASYVKMYALSLLFTVMFLGAWHPLPPPTGTVLDPILPGAVVFAKALAVMLFGTFLRAVYPRYRIDQALKISWHTLTPLSLASLALSALVGVV